ncbi:hypothetical protein ACUY2L_06715 [Corynebacterium mastitidis]
MTTYTTRNEAIDREIIEPLGQWADEHDIDAIADQVLETTGGGIHYAYRLIENLTHDGFWEIVAACAY